MQIPKDARRQSKDELRSWIFLFGASPRLICATSTEKTFVKSLSAVAKQEYLELVVFLSY